ncbi:MAG: TIM barrel protein [Rhizobiales bacterium]|nr:TIM barrel protein [Hyphomicrobiales bacterium]
MPRLAANITMLFEERPFLERFAAAAAAGFAAVECQFPYAEPPERIAEAMARSGLTLALFNADPGDWAAGERGLACLPGAEPRFERSIDRAITYAEATKVERIHVMAGLGDPRDQRAWDCYVANVRSAARRLAERGIELMIEPINRRDMPGYFLSDFTDARALIAEIDEPSVRLQFDVYHRQIIAGDILTGLADWRDLIGHVQIAAVPDRGEPDQGEVDYRAVLTALDDMDYRGWVGCEYRPRGTTREGLVWRDRLLGWSNS